MVCHRSCLLRSAISMLLCTRRVLATLRVSRVTKSVPPLTLSVIARVCHSLSHQNAVELEPGSHSAAACVSLADASEDPAGSVGEPPSRMKALALSQSLATQDSARLSVPPLPLTALYSDPSSRTWTLCPGGAHLPISPCRR